MEAGHKNHKGRFSFPPSFILSTREWLMKYEPENKKWDPCVQADKVKFAAKSQVTNKDACAY